MNRSVRLLWVGETTSELGSAVGAVALPLVALGPLHASTFAVSLLTAAAWLPWLVIGLPAGVWVDRLPRRRVMIAADLVGLGLFLTVPLAYWLDVLTVPYLLAVALLGGACEVFFKTAYRALLPTVVAPEQRLAANARLQGSESLAFVAGPGIAGLLAQTVGAVYGVLVNAISFVVSAACVSRLGEVPRPATTERRHLLSEVADGLRFVVRDSYLRVFVVYGGLSNLFLVGYQAILITFLIRTVGLSPGRVGVLLAVGQVGGLTGALLVRRLSSRFGTGRFLLVSKFVLAGGALLLPLTSAGPGEVLLVGGVLVVSASAVAGNVLQAGFAQGYCPPDLYGRVSASTQVVNLGAIPVGAVLAGGLASSVGLRDAMWVMTGMLVPSASVLLLGPLRSLRELPTSDGRGRPAPLRR